ncbi:MAG: peptidoglycan DD-metalloendopeptidase family protein [Gammaproteobacteria bacterium]|nr:peptidoglycan DD-metalloendopeptidase family protein [Gammaproteobacteria bacterium]
MPNQRENLGTSNARISFKVLSFSLLVVFCLFVPTQHAQEQEQSVEEMLSEVLERLNEKQDWIGQADTEIQNLLESLRTSDKNVATAASRIAEIQDNIASLEDRLNDQESRSNEISKKISLLNSSITWHINVAYRLQRKHWLRTFLEQENAKRNDRYIRYHRYFVSSKNDAIEDFELLLDEMREVSASILDDRSLLEEQQKDWTSQRAIYDKESESRRDQIAELNIEVAKAQRDVDKLLEDRERLESLLVEIERNALASDNQSVTDDRNIQEGSMSWPVEGDILVGFGDSRADGRLKWQGVHIAADTGTDIVAVAPGKVVFANWLMGFGMMLILDHGDEVLTVYGYCDTLFARVGQYVEAGEHIATVGQSGGQTTPGLYFEVRSNGTSTDPIKWLGESTSPD